MAGTKNKSTVIRGCGCHAIPCCGDAMVEMQWERNSDECEDLARASKGVLASCVKSEGGESASVVGCNANNDELGRTLNANNAVANGNDNYAGGFAQFGKCKEHPTSFPSREKTTENHVADSSAEHGQTEYDALPFMACESETNASNAASDIWTELRLANEKRKLKRLRKFYINHEIAEYAVLRATSNKTTAKKKWYSEHYKEIADKIVRDIEGGTYEVRGYLDVDLPQKFKTSKKRHAKIFDLYDRCVQNLILTIIEHKLTNKVVRNNYSNIQGRGILCNDKRYCMINKVRNAVMAHRDSHYLLTDVKKFYESLGHEVVLKILGKTIKDTTTMWLLEKMLAASKDLPIGCCLSPLIADIVMGDYDRIILSAFKPRFFAAFGDNRLYIGSENLMCKIRDFTRSYYKNHYHVEMKGDYQVGKVKDGIRFCKTWYKDGYATVRGEIRRRAIRSSRDKESLASYCGMLNKSDSKRLVWMLKNDSELLRNKRIYEMTPKNFDGKKAKLSDFVGKRICLVNYMRVDNNKDSEYYIKMQIISKGDGNTPNTYVIQSGHHWVKQAYDEWLKEDEKNGCKPKKRYLTVMQTDKSLYFKEYYMTSEESARKLVEELGIDLDELS